MNFPLYSRFNENHQSLKGQNTLKKIITLTTLPIIALTLAACDSKSDAKTPANPLSSAPVATATTTDSLAAVQKLGDPKNVALACYAMYNNDSSSINNRQALISDPNIIEESKTGSKNQVTNMGELNLSPDFKKDTIQYFQDWVNGNAAVEKNGVLVPTAIHAEHTETVKKLCGSLWEK